MHEAQQRAVRRSHEVDQAGLAVADGVRLWLERGSRAEVSAARPASVRPCPKLSEGRKRGAACAKVQVCSNQHLNWPQEVLRAEAIHHLTGCCLPLTPTRRFYSSSAHFFF